MGSSFQSAAKPAFARDLRLAQDRKSRPKVWPTPKNRDADLDEALRALGEDLLNQDIPERLLRVLRSARPAHGKAKPEDS
jgi:hypothetical protein